MAENWQNAPTIRVTLQACPECGAGRPIIVRSEDNGDGSRTRKAVCRQCSLHFKIVVELPGIGNWTPG